MDLGPLVDGTCGPPAASAGHVWSDDASTSHAMTSRRLRRIGLGAAIALLAGPACALAATHTATCQGSSDRCTATFSLNGTRTGDRLVVRLPDTDLQLRSIVPSSKSLTATYGFGGFSTRLGGSLLQARLLRFGRVPRDATVAFTFFVPPAMRSCGDASIDVAGSTVRLGDVRAHGLSCAAARRIAGQCVAGTGPTATAWTIFRVDDQVTFQRRDRRVSFVAGDAGATCVPVG